MGKILILGVLLAVLLFFIARRFNFFISKNINQNINKNSTVIELDVPTYILKGILKKTMLTIGSGILLLLITIVIASKFKIALIMLPVSLYLIGQFFLFNNHLKAVKKQRILYNTQSNEVSVEYTSGKKLKFNLLSDIKEIREFRSVQKNNGILLGYYELFTAQDKIVIPYLIAENLQTKLFFDKLQLFKREIETRLFPII